MIGWLLGRLIQAMQGQPDYAIHITCVDDIAQEDLLGAISAALKQDGACSGAGRYAYGDDIVATIAYGDSRQHNQPDDGRIGTGHLNIGRMQPKGYVENGTSIRVDLPVSKYDANVRYGYCVAQITSNIRMIITQLYCLTGKNPSQFYDNSPQLPAQH